MESKPDRPLCYDCKHRRTIPGDAHTRCAHPDTGVEDQNEFGALVEMLGGKGRDGAKKLGIKAHPQGVRGGWFMWPASFDPVWLENCDGFEEKGS